MIKQFIKKLQKNNRQGLDENLQQISIDRTDKIYYFKKDIEKYSRDNKQFQICVDFNYSSCLEDKISIIEMIGDIKMDEKIGKLEIVAKENNPVNEKLLELVQ